MQFEKHTFNTSSSCFTFSTFSRRASFSLLSDLISRSKLLVSVSSRVRSESFSKRAFSSFRRSEEFSERSRRKAGSSSAASCCAGAEADWASSRRNCSFRAVISANRWLVRSSSELTISSSAAVAPRPPSSSVASPWPSRSEHDGRRESRLTLQEAFDVAELAGIVEFPEVFGLLREIFSLRERVSLVRDEIRGYSIELRNERGEIDVWRIVSLGP
ncbi:hypothetical protein IG631_02786 [Alternaria alternata]|nr:hypothetical protein IG631_02786 [Alternaria alternata]